MNVLHQPAARPRGMRPQRAVRIGLGFCAVLALAGCSGASAWPSVSGAASASAVPLATPSPTPETSVAATYPELAISLDCDTFTITTSAAPEPQVELSPTGTFDSISARTLDPATWSLTWTYLAADYPDGIYVRWRGAPDVTAHGLLPQGCVTIPEEMPTPEVTPTPTATPKPTVPPVEPSALEALCAKATPAPGAAAYTGAVHPLVALTQMPTGEYSLYSEAPYDINSKWFEELWPGPLQLAACVNNPVHVKVGSCGTYTRKSDGARGAIVRYKWAITVRVLQAKTGKLVASKSFYGSVPACAQTLNAVDNPSEKPPWRVTGGAVADAPINTWLTQLSTKVVK